MGISQRFDDHNRQARLEALKAAEGKLQGPRHKKERSAPETQALREKMWSFWGYDILQFIDLRVLEMSFF